MNSEKNEALQIKLKFLKEIIEIIVPVILIIALLKG
jgi:hypothetical protein